MEFKTEGFKTWHKALLPGELAEYQAWKDENNNRVILFNSEDDMVRHFMHNVPVIGNGTWQKSISERRTDLKAVDHWRYGKDFPTLGDTASALSSGATADIYLDAVEQKKQELMEQAPELRDLQHMAIQRRRRRRFSEDGDELDIDRYMCGDPAAWSSMPIQQIKSRTARIQIELAVSGGTDTMDLVENTVTALTMLDIIESAGVRCEVVFTFSTRSVVPDSKLQIVSCIGKTAEEPVDIARLLSFSLPGMYRNFAFAAWTNISNSSTYAQSHGRLDFDINRESVYKFFDASIKIRGGDRYWRGSQIEMMVSKVRSVLGCSSNVSQM